MGLQFTMRESDGVRVHYKKKTNGVRVGHEKISDRVTVHKKKSDGVRVHHEEERWGESLL